MFGSDVHFPSVFCHVYLTEPLFANEMFGNQGVPLRFRNHIVYKFLCRFGPGIDRMGQQKQRAGPRFTTQRVADRLRIVGS